MALPDAVVVPLLASTNAGQACSCMVEVPTPWPEALEACRSWIDENLGRLIEGLHLRGSDGSVAGHLYYALSPNALIPYRLEEDVAVIYCVWVQRRHQGQGYGRLLFEALRRDLEGRAVKGILVVASDHEEGMHHAHFARRGFRLLRHSGNDWLMYYPLAQEDLEVEPLELRMGRRRGHPVEVVVFRGGSCPHEISTSLLALQVAREFGGRVVLKEVPATVENLRAYGASGGVFIQGRRVLSGAVPEGAIRQAICEALGQV